MNDSHNQQESYEQSRDRLLSNSLTSSKRSRDKRSYNFDFGLLLKLLGFAGIAIYTVGEIIYEEVSDWRILLGMAGIVIFVIFVAWVLIAISPLEIESYDDDT
jgi:hypothetical protein